MLLNRQANIYDVVVKTLSEIDLLMERRRQKRVPGPFHGLSSRESEKGFLRFAGQLDQHRKAEDLLQALPSTLHGLISAHTFMVVHEGGTHQTLRRVVA